MKVERAAIETGLNSKLGGLGCRLVQDQSLKIRADIQARRNPERA